MFFRLTYLLVSLSLKARMSAIVSQLSKIFDRYRPTRFWNGSAKVRVNLFLPNFSWFIFQQILNHLAWKSICFRKNCALFFQADGKDTGIWDTRKVFGIFLDDRAVFLSCNLQRTPRFFKRGRKDRDDPVLEQEILRKIADNQWNISPIRILKG